MQVSSRQYLLLSLNKYLNKGVDKDIGPMATIAVKSSLTLRTSIGGIGL